MNNYPIIPCKVVLLGESGVGKTSIISRYINNSFLSNFVPTMGGCYATKFVPFPQFEKRIKFEIWDTAGQEKYRSITKIFYKDANVAILVYDITRKASFDEIKNYWYTQVKENSNNKILISIAANKSDLYEYEEVSDDTGKAFSHEINGLFAQTSAKNATGIEDLFYFLGLKMLDPNFNEIQEDSLMKIRVKNSIKIDYEPENPKKKKRCC